MTDNDDFHRIEKELEAYLQKNPQDARRAQDRLGVLISKFATAAFPAAQAQKKAQWSDEAARRGRNPAQFIRDEYSAELSAGTLTRASLRAADFALYQTYSSWIRPDRHPEDDLRLPTLKELNNAEVGRLSDEDRRRYRRLLSALQRRQ